MARKDVSKNTEILAKLSRSQCSSEVIENQLKLNKVRKNSDVIELYLAKEELTEVPDLSRFKQLNYLWLNHNKIKKINSLKMNYCLKELYLQNNMLTDLTDLFNNPLTQDKDYRLYVIYHLPSVQLLDRQYILQSERDAALGSYRQDQMRIRQSLAFGQRVQTHLLKQTVPKKSDIYTGWMTSIPHQKGILKPKKKETVETSKDEIVDRVRRKTIMEFSTLDWRKVPNTQQKRLGDEHTEPSRIITTTLR
ncbi:leucine-rich repeat-containing protein 72 isoform X4 [Narcine bancroftii]|uniref:leucine-rich repeat-containing protein 72 isoform X4 n=1 Tax=Narcine bancroftii TaxID=1343680 RepID=UPI003831E77A